MPKRVHFRASVSFRIAGEDLDPLEITIALKIPADMQYRRGEPRLLRSRRTGKVIERSPHKFGFWSFSSKPWVQSPRLEAHLSWLLDQLEPHAEKLREFQRRYTMDFFCLAMGRSASPPVIPRSVRARAEALGVAIAIDYYRVTAEHDGTTDERR